MSGYSFWALVFAVAVAAVIAVRIWLPAGSAGRRRVRWASWAVVLLVVGTVLHYSLPQHDVVRIVNTYQERQDLNDWTRIFWSSPDDQSATLINRDVQFIQTVRANGKPMVYRNEDTGWNWPPYFKFDTANLLTEAEDGKSAASTPKWFVMTHYGWRNEFFSIFPNAVGLRPVDSPDVRIIPWVNIIILATLAAIALFIRSMWMQFRERMIDPVLEDAGEVVDRIDDRADAVADSARGLWGRFKDWLGTWRGKPRP